MQGYMRRLIFSGGGGKIMPWCLSARYSGLTILSNGDLGNGDLGNAVACLLRFDAGTEWNNDFLCLPSARQAVEDEVLSEVITEISKTDKVSTISVREDDLYLQSALEAVGFVKGDVAMIQTELAKASAKTRLAAGFTVTSRVERAGWKRRGPIT